MGSEIRRVLRHEKEALEALAKWGHLSSAEVAELLSWSVEAERNPSGSAGGGEFDRPRQNVADYDYWLRGRLDGCQDNTWLADRPLYAAVTLCRLIGAELAELAGPGEEIHVHQLGFEVVSRGEGAIRDALQRLVDMRINRSGEIRKTSGKIYDQFAYSESDDAALDTLRHLTRECILENWAIAPDINVLGEVLRVRRLHSVVSAGNEAGVDPKIIARVLTHIGILPDDDRRPDRCKRFDAESHRALLLELSQWVMFSGLRDTLKSTQQALKNLVNDGILSPRYPKTLLKACWTLRARTF